MVNRNTTRAAHSAAPPNLRLRHPWYSTTVTCQLRQQENGNQTGPRIKEQGVRAGVMESRGGQIGGESAGDRGEDGGGVPTGIGDEATARCGLSCRLCVAVSCTEENKRVDHPRQRQRPFLRTRSCFRLMMVFALLMLPLLLLL